MKLETYIGEATAGQVAHEAYFGAAADTPQNAHAHFRQFSKFGAVAPLVDS